MNVLILGASGLVGGYLVSSLSSAGHAIDAASRHPEKLAKTPRLKALFADLAMPDWISRCDIPLARYEVIYHLAYSTRSDENYNRMVTVESVRSLMEGLQAIEDRKPRHVVYVGSMAVFGSAPQDAVVTEESKRIGDTPYARNKIAASALAAMTRPGLTSTVLHPTGVYAEGSLRIKTYQQLLSQNYIPLGAGGKGMNNIVHAQDVANALMLCLHRSDLSTAEEYIVNGESISYGKWFQRLSATKRRRSWLRLAPGMRHLCRGPIRRWLNVAGISCPLPIPQYKIDAFERQVAYSSQKAARDFGFQPSVTFDEFCGHLASNSGIAS